MRIIFFQPNNRLLRHDGDEFTARAKDCQDYWIKDHDSRPEEYLTPASFVIDMYALPKSADIHKRFFVTGTLNRLPPKSVDRLAVFGHGTSTWCDLGFTSKNIEWLVKPLDRVLTDDARIGLYCCLTGHDVVKGLAVTLSRALPGVHIMAHKSSSPWEILGGHTTDNPYKRMFLNGKYRDMWPADKAAFKAWREELKASKTFEFKLLELDVLEGGAKS